MKLSDFLRDKTQTWGRQSALCRELGVSNGTVSRWIAGDASRITMENCFRIAQRFDLNPIEVFRMVGRADFADLYRRFLPEYHHPEVTPADLYPEDHLEAHAMLEAVLESGDEAQITTAVGVLRLAEERARLLHGARHPRAPRAAKARTQ